MKSFRLFALAELGEPNARASAGTLASVLPAPPPPGSWVASPGWKMSNHCPDPTVVAEMSVLRNSRPTRDAPLEQPAGPAHVAQARGVDPEEVVRDDRAARPQVLVRGPRPGLVGRHPVRLAGAARVRPVQVAGLEQGVGRPGGPVVVGAAV